MHAASVREVYVDLPPELGKQGSGLCAKLLRCLYGTRDASARWEAPSTLCPWSTFRDRFKGRNGLILR